MEYDSKPVVKFRDKFSMRKDLRLGRDFPLRSSIRIILSKLNLPDGVSRQCPRTRTDLALVKVVFPLKISTARTHSSRSARKSLTQLRARERTRSDLRFALNRRPALGEVESRRRYDKFRAGNGG